MNLVYLSTVIGVFKYGYKEYAGGEYDKIGKALSYALINNLKLKK